MGMSNAAVFIKLDNPEDYQHEKIADFFFENIESIKEGNSSDWFDFREANKVIIDITENGIGIMNADFVFKVIVNRNASLISKLYKYFNYPETILAYMHYDSGDSFGFCYVKNGDVKRFRYSLSDDWVTHDYGDPLDEELDILNARLFFEEEEDEDDDGEKTRDYLYQVEGEKEPRSYHFINSDLAEVVMQAKLGFGLYEDRGTQSVAKFVTLKL
jgi:hypothetical protein